MVRYDRIDELVEESGKTKRHLSVKMGHSVRYLNDAKKQNTQICDADLSILALELGTSVAYLKGESDTKKEPPINDEKLSNKEKLKDMFNSLSKEEQDDFMSYVLGKYFPNKE